MGQLHMRAFPWAAAFAVTAGALALGVLAFALTTTTARADSNTTDFESGYTLGSVDGQNGWSATGPYDQAVVNTSDFGSPTGFGTKALRISDAQTSGSFGDWVFAAPLTDSVGEASSTNGTYSAGTKQTHFEMQFGIAAASTTPQPGMHLSVSPDRGDGSRMSYLRFEDSATGINVFFDDVQGSTPGPANFVETQVATNLDRTVPHTIKLTLDAVDGPSNDVVQVYIDGSLVHTGTSWENYFRFDPEASAEPTPRIIKTAIFQARGTATPADQGYGFLLDNVSLTSSSPDVTAPVISGVSANASSTGATITWNTNEPADGQVFYGTTTSYGSQSTLNTTASTTHSATLTGLTPSTTYHYQVSSTDAATNQATTSDATFTTSAVAPLAPTISGVAVSGIASTTATITWNTDLPASSQVAYGTTTGYGSQSPYNGTASTTHSVVLNGLAEGTVYHFAVSSGNITATTTSSDGTFVTQSTASSTPLHSDSVAPVTTNATADGTFANGWKWVMRLTVPDNEDAFRMRFGDWSGSAGTFPGDNNERISSPQSSNASTPSGGIIAPDNNYGSWMYLNGDAATSTPGRQIDVTIEVRIPVGTPAGSYSTTYGAQSTPQSATSTTI